MLNKIFRKIYLFIFFMPAVSFAQVTLLNGAITCKKDPCQLSDILPVIQSLITFFAIKLAMPIAVLAIAFAGLKMVMAAGNSGEVAKSKEIIWNALWGVGVALAAYLIVNAIVYGLTGGQGANEVINERING